MDPDNPYQIVAAHRLLRKSEGAIQYFLQSMVLPEVTLCRSHKLCATGHALGADMLFGKRLGYVVWCAPMLVAHTT